MKRIALFLSLIFLLSHAVRSQTVDSLWNGYLSPFVQTGGTMPNFTVQGQFVSNGGFTGAQISLPLKPRLIVYSSNKCYELPFTALTSTGSIIAGTVTDPSGTLSAIPSGSAIIFQPSSVYHVGPFPTGISASLQGCMQTYNNLKIDSIQTGGITPGDKQDIDVVSTNVWVIDTNAVTTIKIAANAVDSTKIATLALPITRLSQSGATNGQVPKWNSTLGKWTAQDDATGGGGVSDGDKGDITISGSGTVYTIDASAVDSTKIAPGAVQTSDIANAAVTMGKIAQATATSGQVISWNGSAWAPASAGTLVAQPLDQVLVGTATNITSDADYTYNPGSNKVKLLLTDSTGVTFVGLRPGYNASSSNAITIIPSMVTSDITLVPPKLKIGMGKIPGNGTTNAADFTFGIGLNMEGSLLAGADTSVGGIGILMESRFKQSTAAESPSNPYGSEFHIVGRRKLSMGAQTEQRIFSFFYQHNGLGGQSQYANTLHNFNRHDGVVKITMDFTTAGSPKLIFVDSVGLQTNMYNTDIWRARTSDGSTFTTGLMKFGKGGVSLAHNRLIFGLGGANGIEMNTTNFRLNQGPTINLGGIVSPTTFDSTQYYVFKSYGNGNGLGITNSTSSGSFFILPNGGRWDFNAFGVNWFRTSSTVADNFIQAGTNLRINTNSNSAKLNVGTIGGASNTLVTNYVSANNYGSAGAAGLGSSFLWLAKSSTTDDRQQARDDVAWVDATDATRTGIKRFLVTSGGSATPNQEGITIMGDGTTTAQHAKVGINTPNPVINFEVGSANLNTVAIQRLQNTTENVDFFAVNANPNGAITGSTGDVAFGTNGAFYIKESGAATNIGWGRAITTTVTGGTLATIMREESFTATAAQTSFTIAYTAPAVSGTSVPLRVYRNGVRLFWVASGPTTAQFTYSGTTVTTAANAAGEVITVEYLN